LIRQRLGSAAALIGCTGEAIIGTQRELEEEPALALFAVHLPHTTIHTFHLAFQQQDDSLSLHGWPEAISTAGMVPTVLLLCDPFSARPEQLLDLFATRYPGAKVAGGLASGALRPGKNRLFRDDQVYSDGAVGALLWGPARIGATVSHGCQPIGRPWVITKAQENIVIEIGGEPALARFQQAIDEIESADPLLDQNQARPCIGCVVNEAQESFERGDFLIRGIVGIDRESGMIMVSEPIRTGQTIQFHLRSPALASKDLVLALEAESKALGDDRAGALLFACNARGTRMFGESDHDARALGELPLAGFLAGGEIGPIGDRSYLHGLTASMLMFHRELAVDDEQRRSEQGGGKRNGG
jgi:small ligand-binding sensory domain FIST